MKIYCVTTPKCKTPVLIKGDAASVMGGSLEIYMRKDLVAAFAEGRWVSFVSVEEKS